MEPWRTVEITAVIIRSTASSIPQWIIAIENELVMVFTTPTKLGGGAAIEAKFLSMQGQTKYLYIPTSSTAAAKVQMCWRGLLHG